MDREVGGSGVDIEQLPSNPWPGTTSGLFLRWIKLAAWRRDIFEWNGRFSVRRGIFWLAIVSLAVSATESASAQKAAGSAQAGARFAEIWCSGCHAVELRTTRSGGIAPDFPSIANRRSTTARSLDAFLRKSHDKMPNFVLDREDAADVVAYLMSLKRR